MLHWGTSLLVVCAQNCMSDVCNQSMAPATSLALVLVLLALQSMQSPITAALITTQLPHAGHVLLSRFMAQPPPPDCSPPTCLVEPVLPSTLPLTAPGQSGLADGQLSQGVSRAIGAGTQTTSGSSDGCGWVERRVSIAELARLDALGLQRRLAAREAGQDSGWRGFSVTVPYMPGGGAGHAVGMCHSVAQPGRNVLCIWVSVCATALPLQAVFLSPPSLG
jgi:hypothetical protein